MAIRVLIVDDSSFFRRRLQEILSADAELEVIDSAVNGREAVEKALALKPDVITMDIEMPVLDGISAVREILKVQRIPILMFSSLTHEGAKATLDALEAGAVDFLPKKFEDIARDKQEAGELLRERVRAVARRRPLGRSTFSSSALARSSQSSVLRQPLGGRAAEEVVFGADEITTGAANDLQQVTAMARQMVTRFGMSDELGPLSLEGQNTEVFLGAGLMTRTEYSNAVAARIDREVREIIDRCYRTALKIVAENRAAIDRIVDILIDRETMSGDEFRQVLAEHTAIPAKEQVVPQI